GRLVGCPARHAIVYPPGRPRADSAHSQCLRGTGLRCCRARACVVARPATSRIHLRHRRPGAGCLPEAGSTRRYHPGLGEFPRGGRVDRTRLPLAARPNCPGEPLWTRRQRRGAGGESRPTLALLSIASFLLSEPFLHAGTAFSYLVTGHRGSGPSLCGLYLSLDSVWSGCSGARTILACVSGRAVSRHWLGGTRHRLARTTATGASAPERGCA